LATPNYGYEKRQKELAKKRKKEDKLKAKSEKGKADDLGHEALSQEGVDETGEASGAEGQAAGGKPT
jgi:hypothetical protein